MKKIILSAAVVFIALGAASAQVKEGSITYQIDVLNAPPEQAPMLSGMEQVMYYKAGKSRVELSTAMYNMISINDEKKTTTLFDVMGSKMYTEATEEEMKKLDTKKEPEVKIEYKEETKKIAGYDCKKAILKSKAETGEEISTIVWYADQLIFKSQSGAKGPGSKFKNLKGAPLEFEMTKGQLQFKLTATAVSTTPVSDSKFVPNLDGYVKKTLEEMNKMMGGGQ